MNDIVSHAELSRTAAAARVMVAKSDFSKVAVSVLRGDPGAAEAATRCMLELTQARAEVTALNQPNRRQE